MVQGNKEEPYEDIYKGWSESDDEISYGKDIVYKHTEGYQVVKASHGWGRSYTPQRTHLYALFLLDGTPLRSGSGTIVAFDNAANAIKMANKMITGKIHSKYNIG